MCFLSSVLSDDKDSDFRGKKEKKIDLLAFML